MMDRSGCGTRGGLCVPLISGTHEKRHGALNEDLHVDSLDACFSGLPPDNLFGILYFFVKGEISGIGNRRWGTVWYHWEEHHWWRGSHLPGTNYKYFSIVATNAPINLSTGLTPSSASEISDSNFTEDL